MQKTLMSPAVRVAMKRAISVILGVFLIAAVVFLVPTLFGQPWWFSHFFLRSRLKAAAA